MIDLNTLISNALIAAVQQAVAPLNERITALEAQSADHHQRLRVLEGALTDRVVALETKLTEANLFTQMTQAPSAQAAQAAQGHDAWMEQRIAALEAHLSEAKFVEHLDNQEWFWEKLQNRIDAATESAMDDHTSNYDHDDYDSAVSKLDDMPDFDDFVTRDSVREEIEDVINNATISISA